MADTREILHPQSMEEDERDTIRLMPLVDTVWEYRWVIGIGLTIVLGILVVGALLLQPLLPSERIAVVAFRIDMVGAVEGQYPNGARFSPNDIIAMPVLTQVYDSNGLQSLGSFADFASAFLIESGSLRRDSLVSEYQAKLADAKLTPVERRSLEEEFENKLDALNTPDYRLSFRRRERVFHLPEPILTKVLQDTLATWARQADDRKGALRYNLPVLSGNILNWDAIVDEDYLIGIDMLRGKVDRVLENIEKLATLPGADAIRSGPNKQSFAETRVALEDLRRFKIEPLLGFARSSGLSKQPDLLRVYVDNQLFQVQLKRDQALRQAAAIELSLQQYALQKSGSAGTPSVPIPGMQRPQGTGDTPAVIPQFSESFLDRLVQMSSKSDDVGYRQRLTDDIIRQRLLTAELETESAYYDSLKRSLSGFRLASGSKETSAVVERRLKDAFDEVARALQHINALYDQISKNNLNPTTMLYTVTMPVTQQRIGSLPRRTLQMWGLLVLLGSLTLLIAGSLAHHHFIRSPAMARAATHDGAVT